MLMDNKNDLEVGKWRVHLVYPGESYGLSDSLIYEEEDAAKHGMNMPLVEFYDTSQDPDKFPGGQFVSRYCACTLLGLDGYGNGIRWRVENNVGLDLWGDVPSWKLSCKELAAIGDWLEPTCLKPEHSDSPAPSLSSLFERIAGAKSVSLSLGQIHQHDIVEQYHDTGTR